ncbi:phosphatase PAP2 family protein [Dokdonella sp.]|uniref:phosphatase PAP2 family protein n=1 Tax=Dokdonella sp. TaxID=2291710 RepID=UPI0031BE1A9B|nr:phosphatase PAP2 family protein [Dokdonella sp.]
MHKNLLTGTALASALLMVAGLLGADAALARWLRASGWERAPAFTHSLGAADTIFGVDVWLWLVGGSLLALATLGFAGRRPWRWPRILVATWAVQVATLATMVVGKMLFGRLRPDALLALGAAPGPLWFAGGDAFPSGHTAFWFGLLLPLAAATRRRWLRILLLALAISVALGRIGLGCHFLSDVAASALLAALYALLAGWLLERWNCPRAADRN